MAHVADTIFPVPKFHFRVTIDSQQISFQEVSGLEQEVQFLEYRHGDSELYITEKRLGMTKTSTISMKKGTFEGDNSILKIMDDDIKDFQGSGQNGKFFSNGEGIELIIELLDEKAATQCTWTVENAYPIKFVGTDLKSDANEVAIESIDFVHEGFKITF